MREMGRSSAGSDTFSRPFSDHATALVIYRISTANAGASSPPRDFSSGKSRLPSGDCPGRTGFPASVTLHTVAPAGSVTFTKLRWLLRTAYRACTNSFPSVLIST